MNLYQQQAHNRRLTWLVMLGFAAFLFALGYGLDYYYGDPSFPVTAGFGLLLGSLSSINGYVRGDRIVLKSAGAVPLDRAMASAGEEDRLRLRQFENVLDEMAIASGLPRPAAHVIPDPDPNAFATGRNPSRASVAVTQGLLDTLSRDELQGVVAHEMSHIRNDDMKVMTVVAALVGAVALVSDWAGRIVRFGRSDAGASGSGGKKKESGGGFGHPIFLLWVGAVILAPVIAQLLATMVSRRREFLADASAGELTRNPAALASALEKIDAAATPTKAIKRGTANLCIADPLQRPVGKLEGRIADVLASHPPMAKRVAALREMAYAPQSAR